jgi:transposase
MPDIEFDFTPLRVTRISTNGKRWYDAAAKRRLIAACEQPGASIAGLALRAGINANQLHKWIRVEQKRRSASSAADASLQSASAFVPVVAAVGDASRATHTREPAQARSAACLSAQLPNGVTLRLEGVGHTDTALIGAMIAALSVR